MSVDSEKAHTRRTFLKGSVGLLAAGAVGAAVDAFLIEPKWVEVTHTDVAIRDLPPAWEGARIALWCDVHSGYLIDLPYLEKAVALTNAARPDVIVMAGDMVLRQDQANFDMAKVLARLTAVEGKYAVPGNHDRVEAMQAVLGKAGVTTLVNEHRLLVRDGQALCVAGVADLWAGWPDAAGALAGVGGRVPRILACHNPDYAEGLPGGVRVDLMLCGHTHGGQIRIPLYGPLICPIQHRKYVSGLASGPDCQVYTSRGLGMGIIAARLACRPEVPILTLRRA